MVKICSILKVLQNTIHDGDSVLLEPAKKQKQQQKKDKLKQNKDKIQGCISLKSWKICQNSSTMEHKSSSRKFNVNV